MHEGCDRHPTERHVDVCVRCNNNICDVCRLVVNERALCKDCAMVLAGVRVKRRSSR